MKTIRSYGLKAGISIHPHTPIEKVIPFADKVDLILVMTVVPGFGGSSYLTDPTAGYRSVRKAIDEKGADTFLSVDGGINKKTIKESMMPAQDILLPEVLFSMLKMQVKIVEDLRSCITM